MYLRSDPNTFEVYLDFFDEEKMDEFEWIFYNNYLLNRGNSGCLSIRSSERFSKLDGQCWTRNEINYPAGKTSKK
jgi:hypothetical protein